MNRFNILVICGPTACGKTSLAVKLAIKYNGEIISGDSRQVFRGMDIGSGKDLAEYGTPEGVVKYHLIDIADPAENYNLYRYVEDFNEAFDSITINGKLPVLAGGSGLYIEAALKGYRMYPAPEDPALRRSLEGRPREELTVMLMNESPEILERTDTSSARRIIRGIEIARYIKSNPVELKKTSAGMFSPLIIGITLPREILLQKIDSRLEERLSQGMIDEVQSLIKSGVTYERMVKLGLEYRYSAMYLNNEITYDGMTDKLKTEIHKFSKRQMTWLRGMERRGLHIHWIEGNDPEKAEKIINEYIQ